MYGVYAPSKPHHKKGAQISMFMRSPVMLQASMYERVCVCVVVQCRYGHSAMVRYGGRGTAHEANKNFHFRTHSEYLCTHTHTHSIPLTQFVPYIPNRTVYSLHKYECSRAQMMCMIESTNETTKSKVPRNFVDCKFFSKFFEIFSDIHKINSLFTSILIVFIHLRLIDFKANCATQNRNYALKWNWTTVFCLYLDSHRVVVIWGDVRIYRFEDRTQLVRNVENFHNDRHFFKMAAIRRKCCSAHGDESRNWRITLALERDGNMRSLRCYCILGCGEYMWERWWRHHAVNVSCIGLSGIFLLEIGFHWVYFGDIRGLFVDFVKRTG